MSRVYGCRRSSPAAKLAIADFVPRVALGLAAGDVDNSAAGGPVRDQYDTSQCTGEAVAGACMIAAGGAGKYPSHRGLYAGGRALERLRRSDRLVDEGAMIADVVAHALVSGIFPADDRDDTAQGVAVSADINDENAFDEVEAQVVLPPDGAAAISDAARVAGILATLHARGAVVFGMAVDQSYEDWTPSAAPVVGLQGPLLGYHAQAIVGFVGGLFLVRNSWGAAWGRDGHALFAPEAFDPARTLTFDFYSITKAPVLR